MRLEPQFDHTHLRACVAAEYGIGLRRLNYIPRGEVSYSYLAEAEDGARYVLKMLDDSRLAQSSLQRLTFVLPLLVELRSRALLPNVPQPVLTSAGAPVAAWDGYGLVLLSYVEGVNPDEATLLRPDLWAQLARDVAHLHAATDVLASPCPDAETFRVPFEASILDGMTTLSRVTAGDRPGHRALASLLMPREDTLSAFLARLKQLGTVARSLAPSNVLCHTDIHTQNLLIDAQDVLTIIDWEGAKLAPAEHDLFAFTGDDFPAFLDAYLCAGGVRELHAETFGFYFYRRNLEDLTDYIVRILYEDDDTQSAMDVSAIESECLASWPHMEMAMERVRGQLALL